MVKHVRLAVFGILLALGIIVALAAANHTRNETEGFTTNFDLRQNVANILENDLFEAKNSVSYAQMAKNLEEAEYGVRWLLDLGQEIDFFQFEKVGYLKSLAISKIPNGVEDENFYLVTREIPTLRGLTRDSLIRPTIWIYTNAGIFIILWGGVSLWASIRIRLPKRKRH